MSLTKLSAAPPWRALLALAGAVLLAHMALLQALPAALSAHTPLVVRPMQTRSLPAPQAEATSAPPAPAAPRPARRVSPKPPPAPAAPAEIVAAAEPATEPVNTPPLAPEAAASTPEPPAAAAASEPVAPAPPPEPPASAPVHPPAGPVLTHATAFHFAQPVRLLYELGGESKKLQYHARGELLWQQDGQKYDARLTASMLFLGSRTRTSTGSITPSGLAPQRFADKWRSEVAAHFDYATGRASFSANTPEVVLQPAAQDQLSVILQIAGILAADPAHYPVGSTMALQTIGPRDADIWQFTIEGPQKIRVPQGEMDTLKLTRIPLKEFDKRVELWLGPSISYLPVRLKITDPNGDFIDQQLRGVEKP